MRRLPWLMTRQRIQQWMADAWDQLPEHDLALATVHKRQWALMD